MQKILKIGDPIELGIVPGRSALRLSFYFDEEGEQYTWSLTLKPEQAEKMAALLTAGVAELRSGRGEETR